MRGDIGTALDPACFAALQDAIARLDQAAEGRPQEAEGTGQIGRPPKAA
jgi:hypothetical protein